MANVIRGLPSIDDIKQKIENKKNELLNKLYEKVGIEPSEVNSEVNSEELKMLGLGLAYSIDDNVYFGLAQWILDKEPSEDFIF